MGMRTYDSIVIGAGQGGPPLASHLAAAGSRVLVVERKHAGGSCVNFGCTPTKTMAASARVAYHCRRGSDYGVVAGDVSVDMQRVRGRKREIVESFRSGSRASLEEADGIDFVDGHARFADDVSIEIDPADGGSPITAEAEAIYIDTGTRPRIPQIPGLEETRYLTNTRIIELGEVPEHLAIVGGGYVGIEFAQMFRRFGSEVTIIHRGTHLLSREDEDVAEKVESIFEDDGIEVYTSATPAELHRDTDDRIVLSIEGSNAPDTVEASHILVAAGRIPNSDDLGLENTTIKTDERGFVVANEYLETTAQGVYAIGDVKGGPAFTHIAYDDFRILRRNLEEHRSASTSDRIVPYVVYMDPELGRIGMNETDARAQDISYRVATMELQSVARALEMDETRGMLKVLVGTDDRILGAAMLMPFGGELMSAIEIAMMGGLECSALRDGVFAHPTLAESFNTLFASL